MKLHVHNDLRQPQQIEATRVLITDRFDNPIVVVVEVGSGFTIAEVAGSPKFDTVLKSLGIDKTVIVQDMQPDLSPKITL